MAKIFLSHQFTKEDLTTLIPFLTKIVNALKENGHEVFCSTLCQQEIDSHHIIGYDARLAYCLEKQKLAELVIGILISENVSNGMNRELEQAKEADQEYILVIKAGLAFTEYRDFAKVIHEFQNTEELLAKLLPLR